MQQQHPDVTLIAVHDDLSIVGPCDKAFAALQLLGELLETRGDLVLQPHKCRVVVPSDSIQVISTVREFATPYGMTVHEGSMALHGGCVGSDEILMKELLNKKVDRHSKVLKIISDPLMSSPIAYHIIRQ